MEQARLRKSRKHCGGHAEGLWRPDAPRRGLADEPRKTPLAYRREPGRRGKRGVRREAPVRHDGERGEEVRKTLAQDPQPRGALLAPLDNALRLEVGRQDVEQIQNREARH